MVNGININLFDFQEKAVIKLLDIVTDSRSKQTVIVKSPTGSGKTIILIDFIEEYLTKINSRTAFIWLCPGKGDLEEQSRQKMRKFAPHRYTQNLFDALQNGFGENQTLHLIVVPETLISPGGVKYPVSDIDQVQQTPELFLVQFKVHGCVSPSCEPKKVSLSYRICPVFVNVGAKLRFCSL